MCVRGESRQWRRHGASQRLLSKLKKIVVKQHIKNIKLLTKLLTVFRGTLQWH